MTSNQVELTHELGINFINYAMAVNTDRSIPDATTGLKPVHKRILYCALDDGNTSNKKHVKCANIVGSMLAKWHPHGDTAVYDALVRLAQPWIMRYPLIDFHGNRGNQIGDPPAHYRYTECRLAKISEDGILDGVKKHCVDFVPNFDETREEPVNLPAVFPNLLCNPNSGIGVALACSWAPHNLREVATAINDYLDGKEPMLPGPDFPTGGLVLNKDDIPKIMSTGKGTVRIRAKYECDGNDIIFNEIPYGLTVEKVVQELNDLADIDGKLDGVSEIKDETTKKSVRIVLRCKKDANIAKIISTVFAETSLQTSFSYNQVALVDGEPKLLNLKDCIEVYVKHNLSCIVKEYNFNLNKAKARLHIVEGLLKALEDIENIISTIRSSDTTTNAKKALQEKYGFSEEQAKAITDMKLGKLASLEKVEIENERAELLSTIENIMEILNSRDKQIAMLRERLDTIVKKYGDDRITELAQIAIEKKQKEPIVVEPKDCVIIITSKNTIKRIDAKSFKPQKRNTTGVKTGSDMIIFSQKTNTQDVLMVFTSKGKMYRLLVDNIPEGTNASAGAPLSSLIEFENGEKPMAFTTLSADNDKKFIFFATKKGIIKKVPLEEYNSLKRTGVTAIKFKEGDELAAVTFINQEEMMLVTKNGMSIRFAAAGMPISSRTAQGVKGMNVAEDDQVIAALPISNPASYLAIVSIDGLGKRTELKEFTIQNRGGKGLSCYKNPIAGAELVVDDDILLISGDKTSIVVKATELPILNRTSLGNIMLKNNEKVISIAKI